VKDAGFLKADITPGQFFILGGQIAYVAEWRIPSAPNGETDARLRVIYSNGTESNLLLRSLQRALYKDEAGRRISEQTAGPLFVQRKRRHFHSDETCQRHDLCAAQQIGSSRSSPPTAMCCTRSV
jgi:hypothetical protein